MKRILAVFAVILALVGVGFVGTGAVFAEEKCVESNVISNAEKDGKKYYCDDGNGGGIYYILNIVLDIMTYGIGVLAVLGIVISGIQYATAADNEQRMAAAKKRIIEVVIGLAIWAVLYLALKFLLPGGLFGDGS